MTQVIHPPVIDDAHLLFDDTETRQILLFFWPHLAEKINPLTVTTEVRRFAQSLLIVAIESSYALGFVQVLFTTVTNPRGGLKSMAKKLARRFIQHWWKHTTQKDLEDVRIYEAVRSAVASNFGRILLLMIEEATAKARLLPFVWAARRSSQVWA